MSYVLRHRINAGFIDIYYASLFVLPVMLIVFRKISFTDLGLKIGKPLSGLFFVFLLPAILFLRFYFRGDSFSGWDYFPTAIIIGSIAEEFFFRGYLQEQLGKSLGAKIGIIAASALFMMAHVIKGYSFLSSLSIFFVGIYFGFARDKKGGDSVIYAMAAHILYNLTVISRM